MSCSTRSLSNGKRNWPFEEEDQGGADDDRLLLELIVRGKYHIVDRWSPDHGDDDYTNLCRDMLTLSGLDVMKTWKSYRE